jgi:DNA-binding MarR family transcriptional regulator
MQQHQHQQHVGGSADRQRTARVLRLTVATLRNVHNLNAGHMLALLALWGLPESSPWARYRDLEEMTGLAQTGVSRAMTRLAKQGLVDTARGPGPGESRMARLSRTGRQVLRLALDQP